MVNIQGYTVTEKLELEDNIQSFLGFRVSDSSSVILKIIQDAYLSEDELFTIKSRLDWFLSISTSTHVPFLDIERHEKGLVLIFKDFPSTSFKEAIHSQFFSLQNFFRIGIDLIEAVGNLHDNNIIHGDINTANVLLCSHTGRAKLLCYGIISEFIRRHPKIHVVNSFNGSAEYLSPEQTGRMNLEPDYRSDFYSLGVLFYYMLTRENPFKGRNSLEVIHAHIATKQKAPHQINPSIPPMVSEIVQKLLSKSPEERYQTWQGLRHDLLECQKQYENNFTVADFPLAKRDVTKNLVLSEKLFGRKKEVEVFKSIIETVRNGGKANLLLSGEAGIGKTTLVKAMHETFVSEGWVFVSGKLEVSDIKRPNSALILILRELANQLLMENEESLHDRKIEIMEAVGDLGQIVVDEISEFGLIIDHQPEVQLLPPKEAILRYNKVFHDLLQVFGQQNKTIVIFLDDLQWADPSSLDWIEKAITQNRENSILMVLAYKYSDEKEYDRFIHLKNLESVEHISLEPLKEEDILDLVADLFKNEAEKNKALASIIHAKTNGNPYFINAFLAYIHKEKYLKYDPENGQWYSQLDKIENADITENVVDLILNKLNAIHPSLHEILNIAACFEGAFDMKTLGTITQKSEIETFISLNDAIKSGLIKTITGINFGICKFSNERIRNAIYLKIPEAIKKQNHLKIGRVYKSNSSEEIAPTIFQIVNQLNLGSDLMTDDQENEELAQMNLLAAQKSKVRVAFAVAADYLEKALTLLSSGCWEQQALLAYDIHVEYAMCRYALGDFEVCEKYLDLALVQSKSNILKAKVLDSKSVLFHNLGRFEEAVQCGLEGLSLLGFAQPAKPNKLHVVKGLIVSKYNLRNRKPADLLKLPEITDASAEVAMRLLINIFSPAYFINQDMLALAIFNILNISLKFGNSQISSVAYVFYGLLESSKFHNYTSGYNFGQLANSINEKYNDDTYKCKTNLIIGSSLTPWKEHISEGIEILFTAKKIGERIGDLMYAGYATSILTEYSLLRGDHLNLLYLKCRDYLDLLQKVKYEDNLHFYLVIMHMVNKLRGKDSEAALFSGFFNREDQLLVLKNLEKKGQHVPITAYYIFEQQALYYNDKFTEAIKQATLARKTVGLSENLLHTVEHYFFYALSITAEFHRFSSMKKLKYRYLLNIYLGKFKKWSKECPENFEHKYFLVFAEVSRIDGNIKEALHFYDQAKESAGKNGFIQHEALSAELAGKFQLSLGSVNAFQNFLYQAYKCYRLWGAEMKLRQLEIKYPDLTFTGDEIQKNSYEADRVEELKYSTFDLNFINKGSLAISKELTMNDLGESLLQIAIENACASKGILFLYKNEKMAVGAVGHFDKQAKMQKNLQDVLYPKSIVNFVARKKELLVLDDVVNDKEFGLKDIYFKTNKIKSLLCLQICKQNELLGILYLENNISLNAFTLKNIEILKILAAQAAITLQNSALYIETVSLNSMLEEKNNGLILEIAERHLVEQKLKNKNEELNIFLYKSSHDLRSPLSSILGLVNIANNEIKDPTALRYFGMIEKASLNLDAVLLDLIKVTRIKNLAREILPINFQDILDTIIDDIRNIDGFEKVKIETHIHISRTFNSDHIIINSIIQNFLVNAIKYRNTAIHNSFVTVTIEESNEFIKITVADNGVGIEKEFSEKIFDMFYRANLSSTGTGLGLYIVKSGVEKLNGTISMESEPFAGTTFTVFLPYTVDFN